MDVGIGLPNAVPGTTRQQLLDWARASEDAGFSSLGTIDRIVYDNYEPIVALAAAAAVTERIRLATTVMLGPLRMNAAMVAKQVLSLDTLAGGGRAVLGFGLGGRDDDYEISDADMSGRGRWQDQAVAQIRQIFDGQDGDAAKVGPRPPRSGPSLIIGGSVEATFERAARWGDGWIMGGGTPDQFRAAAEQLERGLVTARPRWPASHDGALLLRARRRRRGQRQQVPARLLRLLGRGAQRDDRRQRRQGRRHRERLRIGVRGRRLRRAGDDPDLRRPSAGRAARPRRWVASVASGKLVGTESRQGCLERTRTFQTGH